MAVGIFPEDSALAPQPGQPHPGQVRGDGGGAGDQETNCISFSLTEPAQSVETGGTYELMQFQMKAGKNEVNFL